MAYLYDDDEHGLEQQVDRVAVCDPKIYAQNGRDHQNGAHVDGETANRLFLFDELPLRVVADHRSHCHCHVDYPHYLQYLQTIISMRQQINQVFMKKPVKVTRLSDQMIIENSSPYKLSPRRHHNSTQRQQGLLNIIDIFANLDLHDIRDLDVKRLNQSLYDCASISQFLNKLVRIILQVKDRQQINCQYINTRMQKQIKSLQYKVEKQEQTIATLKKCYQDSRHEYEDIIRVNQYQIRDICSQNRELRSKVKEMQAEKEKEDRNSMEELLYNLKKDNNIYEQQRNNLLPRNQASPYIEQQGLKTKPKQKEQYKNIIKDFEYSFDTPISSGRKKKDYSSLGVSDEDLLLQINELRDNQKNLQQRLVEKEQIIKQLLQLAGMNE